MSSGASQPDTTTSPDPANVQGNVIGGFNKPHQRMVYVQFPNAEAGRALVSALVDRVTTSKAVLDWKQLYHDMYPKDATGRHPDPDTEELQAGWLNLVFSYAGISVLEADDLASFPPEFQGGMAKAKSRIGDVDESDPGTWVAPFNEPDNLHAMIILGADTEEILADQLTALETDLKAAGVTELAPSQVGDLLPGDLAGREHFGFKDGISQPGIKDIDPANPADAQPGEDLIAPGEFVLGYGRQGDPATPDPGPGSGYPTPPAPDPGGESFPSWARDGSYLVYRRLQQNVGGFRDAMTSQADAAGVTADQLAILCVGRYKSGAPLELTHTEAAAHPTDGFAPPDDPSRFTDAVINDFDYEPQDADGHLVPRAAHIRKVYPRNQNPPGEAEAERRRILRRGIPYGPVFAEDEPPYPGAGSPPDAQDRGLLFLCYQRSIRDQFEFIQSTWVNQPGFPQAGDGRDPIISQDDAAPTFRTRDGGATLTFARWVITTGGEYFFSPSISGLRHLAGQS